MIESFRDIQRLASGFQAAKVFLTANDLGLFLELGSQSRRADDVATSLQVDSRSLGLLMNALTAIGLLQKEDGVYRNHPIVYEHLGDLENYRGSIFRHIHHCWDSWNSLPEVVRTGRPDFAAEANALGDNDEWTRDFIQGMNDVTRDLAPHVVPQLGLEDTSVVLDVGGGPGTYAAAFQRAWPNISEVRVFDLPDALTIGQRQLEAWGLANKVSFHPGNFHDDRLPSGADALWLSQVLHSQDEVGCRELIAKSFAALNPGGKLMVHEFLLNDDMASPVMASLFAVHMLVMTEGGRTYSGLEIRGWMEAVGFVDIEVKKVSDDTSVVIGKKL
jgi:SAM-dependent methyltransferase